MHRCTKCDGKRTENAAGQTRGTQQLPQVEGREASASTSEIFLLSFLGGWGGVDGVLSEENSKGQESIERHRTGRLATGPTVSALQVDCGTQAKKLLRRSFLFCCYVFFFFSSSNMRHLQNNAGV